MKNFYFAVAFGLLGLASPCCSAQEVRTVAQCRAYREAWVTSANADIKKLAVRELVQRAKQMVACARGIDTKPFEAGVTYDEAINIAINNSSYSILAEEYYEEAFARAAWYMEKKGLSKQFVADDESGKTVARRNEQPQKR